MNVNFNKLRKNLISKKTTIIKAIKILNDVKFKTLIIIDNNKKILGTLTDGDINEVKCEGRVDALEKDIIKYNLKGEIGIGHVRWATHGKPSKINAHPHSSEKVSVVHNGIIENSTILKKFLEKKGYVFKSQTDTEVIAHLVTDYLKKNSLKETIVKVLKPTMENSNSEFEESTLIL